MQSIIFNESVVKKQPTYKKLIKMIELKLKNI